MNELQENKALKEVDVLFCQMIDIMHQILDIEQKEGFLLNEQHDKLFIDVNAYDAMHMDVMLRNEKKPVKSSEATEKQNHFLISDEDDGGKDDLYIKSNLRKKVDDFLTELF